MPRRDDIHRILVLGSGPIVIGQACEFDYAGTQAVKTLKQDGYEVVLVNSNPATIMTDPEVADRTYIEPLVPEFLDDILARERPDALLPTVGGQTALNLTIEAERLGLLAKHDVELIGATTQAIQAAEDRDRFKAAMLEIGLDVPRSLYVRSQEQAWHALEQLGFPIVIRPSFTLGGSGAAIAYNREEFEQRIAFALDESITSEVLLEESVLGWKEFELEVMRDAKDNFVVVCAIENLDPMGIHTGDSITVAPAQTLTDKEYQRMRDQARKVVSKIGVQTGGCNIQFAVEPLTGRTIVIEMNPRVSRSSALASKATGFPIAKFAAKLAVGYTLDELKNDITRVTPASFEPSIDYVVTKIPRFTFEKFPGADDSLGIQMKSVGEVMGIGRTFRESLGKAICSLEEGTYGFDREPPLRDPAELEAMLGRPLPQRLWHVAEALRRGVTVDTIHARTSIDRWFLHQIAAILACEEEVAAHRSVPPPALLRRAKRAGLSDHRIGQLCNVSEEAVRARRLQAGIRPVYKRIDTCAAEFEARTPYLYSTYEDEDEADVSDRKKVVILGGGPNRIGQGIEFDYCCVHAAFALHDAGFETVMVNCNPETVSTDYDTSDRLYFEPLTREHVLEILDRESRSGTVVGVLAQFGGQTPLRLAKTIEAAGYRLLGTPAEAIDLAEDRERFGELLARLRIDCPRWGVARSAAEAFEVAHDLGYPVLVRPSYVLGGRAMEIVHDDAGLDRYMREAVRASPDHPVLVDAFLPNATEFDVDAVADGTDVVIAGIMEHIEEAGVHSGDSSCSLPPVNVPKRLLDEMRATTRTLARELGVIGLMNVQFALRGTRLYVLEVNPRASRTIPFVAKTVGIPFAKIAARVAAGETLAGLGVTEKVPEHVAVKFPVFPFRKFPGVDTVLGPEMRSTGEVMGIGPDFGTAYYHAMLAEGMRPPQSGTAFFSVMDEDKEGVLPAARKLHELGFELAATRGTAAAIRAVGLPCRVINKAREGRPNTIDALKNHELQLVINTTGGTDVPESFSLRRTTLLERVPYFTTVSGALAAAHAIARARQSGGTLTARAIQDYHRVPGSDPESAPAERVGYR